MRLTVAIPVHDRFDKLRACLRALAPQECPGGWEAIVLADASPPGIDEAVAGWPADGPPLRVERLPKGGPARARNHAAGIAQGAILLYLNDDSIPQLGCLAAHEAAHRAAPGHAVVGNTRWDPACCGAEFMHWAAHHDDFFYCVEDHRDVGWDLWHTLNASIDRKWLDEGHAFDETYPDPAFEDTEFAYRLAVRHGLEFRFAPGAIVLHDHASTPDQYLAKSVMRGASARRFVDAYPEQRDRILREYEIAAASAGGWRLAARTLLRRPDGVAQWHARFAQAFLAGYHGRPAPWTARRCC